MLLVELHVPPSTTRHSHHSFTLFQSLRNTYNLATLFQVLIELAFSFSSVKCLNNERGKVWLHNTAAPLRSHNIWNWIVEAHYMVLHHIMSYSNPDLRNPETSVTNSATENVQNSARHPPFLSVLLYSFCFHLASPFIHLAWFKFTGFWSPGSFRSKMLYCKVRQVVLDL